MTGLSAQYACLRTAGADPLTREPAALLSIARDFSPRVMRVSEQDVLLDVSGLGRLIGGPSDIARELTRALHEAGVAGAVGLGSTQTTARLLAADDDRTASIARLPVARLQPLETLPRGMNERDRTRPYDIFEQWGIATLGDLAALPSDALASRLGRRGAALRRLARGEDLRPFVPDADVPRFAEQLELEWPIETLEPLSFVLARLLDALSAALERADRGAAAIRLDLRLTDRSTHHRLLQLPVAMRDARVLRTLLLLDLESNPPPAAIDVAAIEIDPAPARITQFSLLTRALPSPETLSTLTARLSALVGESQVGSPVLLDSHRPDAFALVRYAPEKAGTRAGEGGTGGRGPAGVVLRRYRPPVAIRVSVLDGRPVHVATSRRGIPSGGIEAAAGPWRSSGDWWTDSSWNRNEWDVALKNGPVGSVFQNRTTGCWFFEGVYD